MIPSSGVQIPQFVPELCLIVTVVVNGTLSGKGFIAHLHVTFPTPNSFTRSKGPSLEGEVCAKYAPPVYQSLATILL
jgi:hypothetical protein